MMINQSIPFAEKDGKITLEGCCLLSCGCGNVTARWATLQQNIATRLPQAKPKASKMVAQWLADNKMYEKYPVFKQHQYGMVVGETEDGIEAVNIMGGATSIVATKIGDLIKRNKEWTVKQSSNN